MKELRALEPSAGMREVFAKATTDPRVSVHPGTFDTTGVEDGWADLIVIAQVCLDPFLSLGRGGGNADPAPGLSLVSRLRQGVHRVRASAQARRNRRPHLEPRGQVSIPPPFRSRSVQSIFTYAATSSPLQKPCDVGRAAPRLLRAV